MVENMWENLLTHGYLFLATPIEVCDFKNQTNLYYLQNLILSIIDYKPNQIF